MELSGTNKLYVTLDQSIGENWVTANVIVVNASGYYLYNYTPTTYFTPQNITVIPGGLVSGGSIWVQYQTSIGGPFYYARMAFLGSETIS